MSKAKYQGYEALEQVLNEALEQAAAGKGKERHAQDKPFDEQPMQLISELIGDTHGMAFQAIKKLQESLRLPTDRAIREQLGAINYIAGMVIMLRKNTPNLAAAKMNAVTNEATTRAAEPTDTVPLKQYNNLLARYTELEKRLLEVPSAR